VAGACPSPIMGSGMSPVIVANMGANLCNLVQIGAEIHKMYSLMFNLDFERSV